MTADLRVLVADDSTTVRQHISDVLRAEPGFEVVGEAQNGKEAIELCARLRPDVMTLDMMMPVMTGLAATEHIMAHCPTPILIVSASTNRGELFRTYDALAAGAVDVLDKPSGEDDGWERKLVRALRVVARVRVITHLRGRLGSLGPQTHELRMHEEARSSNEARRATARSLVAIGASTGGPGAIVQLLRGLRAPFPSPVLVVLHIGGPFGAAFADWLDAQTSHRVASAVGGEPLDGLAGRVVLAPPDRHMAVRGGRIVVSDEPERHSCKPSVDVLFESLAMEMGARTVAALLTGMGRDGALGLLQLRRAGALTIAQDEDSCIVYGMPREAALLGAADRILPLDGIAPVLSDAVAPKERSS